jgi:hypothetical protein
MPNCYRHIMGISSEFIQRREPRCSQRDAAIQVYPAYQAELERQIRTKRNAYKGYVNERQRFHRQWIAGQAQFIVIFPSGRRL